MTVLALTSRRLSGRCQVLDGALLPRAEGAFAPFRLWRADLPPGAYHLRLRLNDGRTLRRDVVLHPEAPLHLVAEAMVEGPDEPVDDGRAAAPPTPSGLETLSNGPPERTEVQIARLGLGGPMHGLRVEGTARRIVLRHTHRGPDHPALAIVVRPPPDFTDPDFADPDSDPTNDAHLGVARPDARTSGAGTSDIGTTPFTLILPRCSVNLELLLAPGAAPRLEVTSAPGSGFRTLLDVLAAPAPDAPDLVFEALMAPHLRRFGDPSDVSQVAQMYVRDKFLSPDHAAAGGWYLLKVRRMATIRDWTRNLADYFADLPDGAVLEGWRRLSPGHDGDAKTRAKGLGRSGPRSGVDVGTGGAASGNNPPYPVWRRKSPPQATRLRPDPNALPPDDPMADAAIRFVEAAEAGVPRFSEGVVRLAQGLDWCLRRTPPKDQPPGLAEARARARAWAAALVPGNAFSLLRGSTDDLGIAADTLERLTLTDAEDQGR